MPETLICAQTIDELIEEWTTKRAAGRKNTGPLHIVAVGAHPDDPETGCGGTLAQFASQGHKITLLYLTRGEEGRRNGVAHLAAEEIAEIRTREAQQACEILKARPIFVGQVDKQTSTDEEHSRKFTETLLALKPDIVFTHWGEDTHADHRNAAELTRNA